MFGIMLALELTRFGDNVDTPIGVVVLIALAARNAIHRR